MGLVLNLQIMLSMMMIDGYDEYDVYDDGYDANDFLGVIAIIITIYRYRTDENTAYRST